MKWLVNKNKYFELRGREERKKQRAREEKSECMTWPSIHPSHMQENPGSYNVTTHNDAKRSRIVDGQKRVQGLERCRIEDRIAEKQIQY